MGSVPGTPEIPQIQETRSGITFQILVSPRSSRAAIGPLVGDRIKVSITEPPVEGRANAAVVALLAKKLGVRRDQVEILAGQRSRRKTVRVEGATRRTLLDQLGPT